jgi:CheY-like chemotaxis protein
MDSCKMIRKCWAGPDLAGQDDVMEKEVWGASKSNGISKSTPASRSRPGLGTGRAGRNRNIPVVALTAYAMKGDREKTIEAGCTGYIEKPIDPETIIAQIKQVIGEEP